MGASGWRQKVNYRTTCPHCTSVFRLGADQLGAAQGWVQCSVCGTAFDARLSLLMEDGSPLPPPEPEAVEAASQPEVLPPAEHEAHAAALAATAEAAASDEEAPEVPREEDVPVASLPHGIVNR